MSLPLIDRSLDLQNLRFNGYHIELRAGYLLIKDVPYVNASREVKKDGVLISKLELAADKTCKPTDHVTYWMAESHPHKHTGEKITSIENPSQSMDLGNNLIANFTFSAKADYSDYFHKMETYVNLITSEAQIISPDATAKTFPVAVSENQDSVFEYENTAISRDHTGEFNNRLAKLKVGIVGIGGTGSYILDMVSKTQVQEIHLFDGDSYLQHNAFRSPGATSINELERRLKKVTYWYEKYSAMRKNIIPHTVFLEKSNLALLNALDFVFLCLDTCTEKTDIIQELENQNKPFIDVGLGIHAKEKLDGLIRVSTSTSQNRESAHQTIPLNNINDNNNDYSTNIQVAELNALNAAFAVIRWKKLFNFYQDKNVEHYSSYWISANEIINEDKGGTSKNTDQ